MKLSMKPDILTSILRWNSKELCDNTHVIFRKNTFAHKVIVSVSVIGARLWLEKEQQVLGKRKQYVD